MIAKVYECFYEDKPDYYTPINYLLNCALSDISETVLQRDLGEPGVDSVLEMTEELMEKA